MLSKIIGALPTSALNAVFDAAFDELKRRGEIIEDEQVGELTSDKVKILACLGLKIKLVVEPDFACWYVYDGDPDPILSEGYVTKLALKKMRIKLLIQRHNGWTGTCQVNGKFMIEVPLLPTRKEIKLTLASLLTTDLIAYQPAE